MGPLFPPRTQTPPAPPGRMAAIASHKATTHAGAAAIGAAIMAALTAVQSAPVATDIAAPPATLKAEAPKADTLKADTPKTEAPKTLPETYEAKLRKAWAQEKDGPELTKMEKVRRLLYAYRRMAAGVEGGKWKTLGELDKSIRAELDELFLLRQLTGLRRIATDEWDGRALPETADTLLTGAMRAKIASFYRDTIAALERLPG